MGVDRDRVGAIDAAEEVGHLGHARRREAVGAVDVEPDVPLGADVGERIDRVDGTGQRRAGRRDDRDRDDAGGEVGVDGRGDGLRAQAAPLVDRERAHLVRADPEQLGGADDRVVHLRGAVEGEAGAREALVARAGERTLPRGRQRGQVRGRAAARERARLAREADELARPADGLHLDLGGGARPDGEVDVVAGGERVGDHPDLEPRRADEGEVARPRLRDALVERPRRVGDRLPRRRAVLGKPEPAAARSAADRPAAARPGTGRSSARPPRGSRPRPRAPPRARCRAEASPAPARSAAAHARTGHCPNGHVRCQAPAETVTECDEV